MVNLTAPETPGAYSVYWSLKNDVNETFYVDGGGLWVIILVCEPGRPCFPPTPGGGASVNGVTATLTSFVPGATSTEAGFCMTLPNSNYGPGGGTVSLLVDQQAILASSGGSLGVNCFEFEFPVTADQIEQAQYAAISIESVRILGGVSNPQAACEMARVNLMQQYPGLDFECAFGMGTYYTNLQLPPGMTAAQAGQLITDAIEGAIYGPWVLEVK